jgi:hypothetical protein
MLRKKIFYRLFIFIILIFFLYFSVNFLLSSNSLVSFKSTFDYQAKQKIKKIFFPYLYIKQLEQNLINEKETTQRKMDMIDNISKTNIRLTKQSNFSFNKKNLSEFKNIKQKILTEFILPKKLVSISEITDKKVFANKNNFHNKLSNNENFKIFKSRYYSIDHFGILELANKNCEEKKLIIYNAGHTGNPFNNENFLKIKNFFYNNCYDFFTLGMTGIAFNLTHDLDFPGNKYKNDQNHSHVFCENSWTECVEGRYESFLDSSYPKVKPLSLMLSGNYYLIHNLLNRYDYNKINYIGLSGGGWYVTLLSSVIEKIQISVSFAGTIPLIYRTIKKNRGDWEQFDSKIYDFVTYIDLYTLNTLDSNFNSTRKHFQIYNNEDSCCFDGELSNDFKSRFKLKNFEIYITNNNQHIIDFKILKNIIQTD